MGRVKLSIGYMEFAVAAAVLIIGDPWPIDVTQAAVPEAKQVVESGELAVRERYDIASADGKAALTAAAGQVVAQFSRSSAAPAFSHDGSLRKELIDKVNQSAAGRKGGYTQADLHMLALREYAEVYHAETGGPLYGTGAAEDTQEIAEEVVLYALGGVRSPVDAGADAVALAWGELFYPFTQMTKLEVTALMYEQDGVFSTSGLQAGGPHGTGAFSVQLDPGATPVAIVHTHPDGGHETDVLFSAADARNVDSAGIDGYVALPDGTVRLLKTEEAAGAGWAHPAVVNGNVYDGVPVAEMDVVEYPEEVRKVIQTVFYPVYMDHFVDGKCPDSQGGTIPAFWPWEEGEHVGCWPEHWPGERV